MSLSLLAGVCFLGTARSCQGRAVVWCGGEERWDKKGKACERLVKGGPAKMAPSRAALDTLERAASKARRKKSNTAYDNIRKHCATAR